MSQDKQLRPTESSRREKTGNAQYPAGTEKQQRIVSGEITAGNNGAGYSVSVLGEDGEEVTTHTRVRKMAGDAVLMYLPNEKQPVLLYTPFDISDAGEGCLTVFSS